MPKKILKQLSEWDYANLTKNAHQAGGVQQFVTGIYKSGFTKGAITGSLTLISVAAVGYGIKVAVQKLKKPTVKAEKLFKVQIRVIDKRCDAIEGATVNLNGAKLKTDELGCVTYHLVKGSYPLCVKGNGMTLHDVIPIKDTDETFSVVLAEPKHIEV